MEEPEGRTFSEHPVAGIDRSDGAIVIHLTSTTPRSSARRCSTR
jgi:hypothetical protein